MCSHLSYMTVLDLSRFLPGPFCSLILSDMGAEVIRIEDPDNIDLVRTMKDDQSYMFDSFNRGKKSVSIRLKNPKGQAIFKRLVKDADVVLEGFRPGYMHRRGLGYEDLHYVNSKLVYCSLSGFGQAGPYAMRGGHDLNYQAIAGTLIHSKIAKSVPVLPPVVWGDFVGSLTAAMSILMSLLKVKNSGEGSYIDASMLDGLILLNILGMATATFQGRDFEPGEHTINGGWACYYIYRTSDDGYMALGALEPPFWEAFCKLVDRPDLIAYHMDNSQQTYLLKELTSIFASKTLDEWVDLSRDVDCCLEPIHGPYDAIRDPQVISRGHLYPTQSGDKLWNAPGLPMGLIGRKSNSSNSGKAQRAPRFGEHTREILQEAGISEQEINSLADAGVITFG